MVSRRKLSEEQKEMLPMIQDMQLRFWRTLGWLISLLLFVALAGETFGQSTAGLQNNASKPDAEKAGPVAPKPVKSIYKELKIGSSAEEVRRLLGKAEIDDKDGFFYDTDSEVVQIRLDPNGLVRLVAVTYSADSPGVPKFVDIFGVEPAAAKPDGSIYKLVRYPEAGYWVAFSKTAGDKPSVTVTMQKL